MFNDMKVIFLSIVIEALPFLLIGALAGTIIEVIFSEEKMKRLLPRNFFLQITYACFLGIFFPICECAIIPVAARLIQRGVPLHLAITFMLATPIVNPVAVGATGVAFINRPDILYWRVGSGVLVAVLVGLLFFGRKGVEVMRVSGDERVRGEKGSHGHGENTRWQKLSFILRHTRDEFFNVGIYLVIGALLVGAIQMLLPQRALSAIADQPFISILSLQGLGYALSLCSHADAFVGASFANLFPSSSILAFLITSPLIDIKNTLILLVFFRKKFCLKLIGSVLILAFVLSSIVHITGWLHG